MPATNTISADVVRIALAQMKPRPCLELYPGDWVRDDVSGLSLAAQGFWLRTMFVMHDAKPYGHLVGAAGEPLSDVQILKRCGAKNRHELNKIRAEIESAGVPGFSGDLTYTSTLNSAEAAITIAGVTFLVDLSPLGVTREGITYSRRMLRDRRLSLLRFFVSPKGQLLIPQSKDLTTQKLNSRARVGAEKEEEVGSLSQPTKSGEGVQGEGDKFEIAARLEPLLDVAGFEFAPAVQVIIAWIENGIDEKLIRETLADCENEYRGKSYRYFEKILLRRRDDPTQRPGRGRARSNDNGRDHSQRGQQRPVAVSYAANTDDEV